jgi:hypothetical protein
LPSTSRRLGGAPDIAFVSMILNTAVSCLAHPLATIRGIASVSVFLTFLLESSDKREGLYNILWALVFGFATLNILGLLARRFETGRNRLSFGEIAAILVVGVSVLLLAWEMLNLFKIFPIKLGTH